MKRKQRSNSLTAQGFTLINNLESSINKHLKQINKLYTEPLHEKIFDSIAAKAAFSHIKNMIQQMHIHLTAIDLIIQEALNTKDENRLINTLQQKYTFIDKVFKDIAPHRMLLNYIDQAAFPSRIDKDLFKSMFHGVVEKSHELHNNYAQTELDLTHRDIEKEPFYNLKEQFDELNYNIGQVAKLMVTRIRGGYAIDPNQYAWVIIMQINLNHFEQELGVACVI